MGSSRSTWRGTGIRTPFSVMEGRAAPHGSTRPRFWEEVLPKPRQTGAAAPPNLLGLLDLGVESVLGDHGGGAVRLVHHGCESRDALPTLETHDDHALGRAPEPLDVLDGHADHLPARRHEHDGVAVPDHEGAGELAASLRELNRLHAHGPTALGRVLVDEGALAVAVPRHDEKVGVITGDVGGDHLVVLAQAHPDDTRRRATHRPDLLLGEARRLTPARDEKDVVLPRRV